MSMETLLDEVATCINSIVAKVLINDTITIDSFVVKSVAANVFEIQFLVLATATELITDIKLLKSDNTILSTNDSSVVHIPVVVDELLIRHRITTSEVV